MNSLKSAKQVYNQLNYILTRQEKKKSIIVFLITFIGSFFELMSVSVILPFIQALIAPEMILKIAGIRKLVELCGIENNIGVVVIIGVLVILLFLFKNAYLLWTCYMQKKYAIMIYKNLSTKMLDSYMQRPYSFFLNINSADIIRGISGDTDGVYEIIQNIFTLLAETITIFLIGILLLYSDLFMAISALGIAGIALIILVFWLRMKMKTSGQKARHANIAAYKFAYQAVNGIKEITVMQRREYFVKKYSDAVEKYQKMLLVSTFISACPDRVLEGIFVGGFIGIVCIRISLGIDLANFIPTLAVFAMASFKVLPSVSKIVNKVNMIVYYQPSLKEAYNNIKSAREYQKINNESILENDRVDIKHMKFTNQLKISNISWKYSGSDKNVLNDCSLKVNVGESVAFIGASGAGKTTLADIIMGLFHPKEGNISVDGIDIFKIPKQWGRMIGYVPQTVYLIDDTIRNNISFGLDNEEIDDELVWSALEQAQLKLFVQKLPKGLDTIVGERGIKFSGGQRQRVALARALYYNPDILVLDEATSALDNDTEHAVMESITALQGKKTLIIVAHRLSTIKDCDKIYEVCSGKVILKDKSEIFS